MRGAAPETVDLALALLRSPPETADYADVFAGFAGLRAPNASTGYR
jgi:hypothetical protein